MEPGEESQLVDNKRKNNSNSSDRPAELRSEEGHVDHGPTSQSTDRSLTRDVAAYGLVFVSVAASVVSTSAVQSLDRSVPHAEVNLARFFAQLILMVPYLVQSKVCLRVEHPQRKWVAVTTISFYVYNLAVYGSPYSVAVGSAISIDMSVALIAFAGIAIALGDATKSSIGSVLICATGILFVTQPDFVFGLDTSEDKGLNNSSLHTSCFSFCENMSVIFEQDSRTNMTDIDRYGTLFGYLLAVVGGLCGATNSTLYNKPLAVVNPVVVAFWITVPGIGISTVQMLATEIPTWPGCWFCTIMLCVHSFCAALSTIFWIIAMSICTSPLLAAIVYSATTIPASFAVQYTLLASMYPGHRNWMEYVGATLCLVGAVVGPACRLWCQFKERRDVQ